MKHILKTILQHNSRRKLWLRAKDIGEELDVENIYDLIDTEIKGKYETNNPTKQQIRKCKRRGSKLINDEKFMHAHKDIITPIIMHCRVSTPKSTEIRSRLGFNQHDIMLTKEQSVLRSVMDGFEGERMQTQCSVLGYDLYFCDYRLAIEVNEKGHCDRDFNNEIEIQEAIKEKLNCGFIRINPDE